MIQRTEYIPSWLSSIGNTLSVIAMLLSQVVKYEVTPLLHNQILGLYRGFHLSLISSIVIALSFVLILWGYVPGYIIVTWLLALFLCLLFRGTLVRYFFILNPSGNDLKPWIVGAILWNLFSAGVWGSIVFFALSSDDGLRTVAISVGLITVAIGGAFGASSLRLAAVIFYLTVMVPLTAWLFFYDSGLFFDYGLIALFFGSVLLAAYWFNYKSIIGFIQLNDENRFLEKELERNKSLLFDRDKSDNLFRDIVEGTSDLAIMVHEVSNDGLIVYANQAACNHFECSRDELLAKRPKDYSDYAEEIFSSSAHSEMLSEGKTLVFNDDHRTFAGKKIPVEISVNLLKVNGEFFLLSYTRDRSERESLEKQKIEYESAIVRQEAELQFHSLVDAYPDLIVRLDLEGKIQYASDLIIKQFGLNIEDIAGKTLLELNSFEANGLDHKNIHNAILEVISSKEAVVYEEWTTHVSARRCYEVRHVPEYNQLKEVVGVIGFTRDITERATLSELLTFLAQEGSTEAELFYPKLLAFIGQLLDADFILLQTLNQSNNELEIKASHGVSLDITQPFVGSLCEKALETGAHGYDDNICEHLPNDRLIQMLNAESGGCFSLCGADNVVFGFLNILNLSSTKYGTSRRQLVQIAASRLIAELENERLVEAEIARKEDFRLLVEGSPDYISRFNSTGECIYLNPAIKKLGDGLGEVVKDSTKEEKNEFHDLIHTVLKTGNEARHIYESKKMDKNKCFIDIRVVPERGKNGEISGALSIGRDVTDRVQLEEELRKQASIDSLTDLPNRRGFSDSLEIEIAKARREHKNLGLMFLDLDRFKEINDTLGHDAGDLLLQQSAIRIKNTIRGNDIVARLGGDEFVILLSSINNPVDLGRVADSLIDVLAKPFEFEGQSAFVSASIGIAVYPLDADNPRDLMSYSDQAMYSAKEDGRNMFRFFTKEMQVEANARASLVNDLRVALDKNQLQVFYQPIIETLTDKVVKAEALIRWLHPQRGFISPIEFIPIAEDTGLIDEIGNQVFQQAITMAKTWQDKVDYPIQVSVNISSRQFNQQGIVESWLGWLNDINLSPSCITLELTESLLLGDQDGLQEKFSRIRESGMQLALDDFGTGYSAMAYLKKFNIDYLKIDGSFVRDMTKSESDRSITETIVLMASKLGMKSVAECVETVEQRQILKESGCDYLQGYLYAKPMPVNEFFEYIISE